MNAFWVLLIAIATLGLAYRFYGRFLARRVFCLEDSRLTPAHTMHDRRDYVPTHFAVMFGHHFASIAGLGPLLGPAIAVIWGWLPALVWILVGSVFIGAMHDLGCLFSSIRNKARSVADITEEVLGNRARILFLLFVIFAVSLAMGVFVLTISRLFSPGESEGHVPEAVLPSGMLIVIAVTAGVLHYRYRVALLPLTIGGVVASLIFVWLGMQMPLTHISSFTFTPGFWKASLMFYAFIASVLPVWLLLQPRDYINSFQLYLGMTLLFLGVLIGNPQLTAPAINTDAKDLQPLFPMLFITVACGAVSGFHSLVASGTTSKQLSRERHALPVAYGGMLTEGLLATLALLAVAALAEWSQHYSDWKGVKALPNFIHGAGTVVAYTGIPIGFAKVFIATVATGFALTTLDSATRLLRYNIQELACALKVPVLRNLYLSTGVAILLIGFFAISGAGMVLWQLFGATNQLLAALALLVISLYLRSLGQPTIYTTVPMGFMLVVTISALLWGGHNFWIQGNWLLLVFSALIFLLAVWLLVETVLTLRRKNEVRTHQR